MTLRRFQLLAYVGIVILAIVLITNQRKQGSRITKIERQITTVSCTTPVEKQECQRVVEQVIASATPGQLRRLGTRLVTASPRGADGRNGANGKKGSRGSSGLQGPQGPRGKTGAQGAPGPVGPLGARGPIGPMGPIGHVGPPGPVGRVDTNAIAQQVYTRLCARLVNLC